MVSGWPGKGHGALLKNSLYARFEPRLGPKHRIGGFMEPLEPDPWRFSHQAGSFSEVRM